MDSYPVHRLGLLDIVKIVFLPESVVVGVIAVKTPTGFFMEFDNLVLQFTQKGKEKPRHS